MSEKVSQPGDLDKFVPTKKPLVDPKFDLAILRQAGKDPQLDLIAAYKTATVAEVADTGPMPPAMDRDVKQPTHYTAHPSGIECITIAQHFNFNVGNAVKYLWRAGLKVPKGVSETEAAVKDLKKAKEYIDFEIRRLTL